MSSDRDDVVARALDDLEVPEHSEGFFAELQARLAEPPVESVVPGPAAVGPVAAGPAVTGPEADAPVPLRSRRRVLAGALAAALAAAVAVAAGVAVFFVATSDRPGTAPGPAQPSPLAYINPLLTRHGLNGLLADGSRIYWLSGSAGKKHLLAESMDLDTGAQTSLKKLAQHLPTKGTGNVAVSGDRVAWIDQSGHNARLFVGTLPETSPSPIGPPTRNVSARGVVVPGKKALRLSSRFAVWVDARAGKDALWAYDFAHKTESMIPGSEGAGDQYALGGSLVAWILPAGDAGSTIVGYDLAAATSFTVPLPAGTTARDMAISGSVIVWSDDRNATSAARDDNNDIYAFDVATGHDLAICEAPGMQTGPAIDGDLIAWLDARPSAAGSAAEPAAAVYGYDLSLSKEFPISADKTAGGSVKVTGQRVIWSSQQNGQVTVYGATVTRNGDQIVVEPIKP